MAEGGEGSGDDNPFSYKNFVNKRSSPDSPSSKDVEEDDDSFEIPDLRPDSEKRPHNRSQIATDDEPEKPRKKDDNPFSFKKFLRSGGARPKSTTSSNAYCNNLHNGSAGRTGDISTLDLANDLPDFVQDHFSGHVARSRPLPDVPLPDFTLDSNAHQHSFSPSSPLPTPPSSPLHNGVHDEFPEVPMGALPNGGGRPRVADNLVLNNELLDGCRHSSGAASPLHNDDYDDGGGGHMCLAHANAMGGLPDFISDSAASSCNNHNDGSHSDNGLHHASSDIELQLTRLREENTSLRRQLEEARQLSETESKRVAKAMEEMEAIQKKEAEETAALEKMVQQVEANLVSTTERAVKAEATVSRLKQELKSLQSQGRSSTSPKRQGSAGGQGSHEVMKQKAKYASEQVAAAADTAEQKLKDLMSGVETLRLVSQVLASIDRVSEETDDDAERSSPQPGATSGTGTSKS